MRKIRIAQIGLNINSHSGEIFDTLKAHPEIFDIAGYTLVEDERITCAHKTERFKGYKELTLDEILNDETIEAVAVETDEVDLTKYAIMAAEHGKHIHMEKPGSQSLADFERLIEIVRKNGTVFHIGYMYRYNPYISDCIRRANNGELGEIFSVETHMSRSDGTAVREWLSNFRGGMMFYLGCHLVDLVLQIQGIPEEVHAFNSSTGYGGIDSEDNSLALLKYKRGYSIVRVSGTEIAGFDRRQLVVMGDQGTIEIRPLETRIPDALRKTEYPQGCEKREALLVDGKSDTKNYSCEQYDRYESMMFAFAEMVRGEKKNPYTLEYELELFKTILKCCGM